MYVGYELTEHTKKKLMEIFPPKYSRIFGHHITTKFGTSNKEDIPGYTEEVQVIAYSDSGDGLEALVVSVDGDSRKEDGNFFHITWSLDPQKYKPVDSNKLVSTKRQKITPIPIQVAPRMFTGTTPFTDRSVQESFLDFLKRI